MTMFPLEAAQLASLSVGIDGAATIPGEVARQFQLALHCPH
jgi:hypothetical protein